MIERTLFSLVCANRLWGRGRRLGIPWWRLWRWVFGYGETIRRLARPLPQWRTLDIILPEGT